MANNLEKLTDDYSSVNNTEGLERLTEQQAIQYQFPALYDFTNSIKNKKRKKEMEKEVNRIFSNYIESIKKSSPASGRAALLEQSYHLVPDEEEIEGKDAKEVLEKRLYSNPGRQYRYVNGIIGDKKKSKDIKYELGRAGKYAIKEGWPVLGAGAGWILANRFYKKNPKAFNNKWWQYLGPTGVMKFGVDAGKSVLKQGFRAAWGLIGTPALYAIGAYAAYKTIGYLLRRRKEKKLEREEMEKLENIRNDMLAQRQMFQMHQGAVAEGAM